MQYDIPTQIIDLEKNKSSIRSVRAIEIVDRTLSLITLLKLQLSVIELMNRMGLKYVEHVGRKSQEIFAQF
jgi:hypothetical protein